MKLLAIFLFHAALTLLRAGCAAPPPQEPGSGDARPAADRGLVADRGSGWDGRPAPTGVRAVVVGCGHVPVNPAHVPRVDATGAVKSGWSSRCTVDLVVPTYADPALRPPLVLWFPGGGFSGLLAPHGKVARSAIPAADRAAVMPLFVDPSEEELEFREGVTEDDIRACGAGAATVKTLLAAHNEEIKGWATRHGWAVGYVHYYLATPSDAETATPARSWPYLYACAKRALVHFRRPGAAAGYGIDSGRTVVAGFSAGATVAAFLGVTSGFTYDDIVLLGCDADSAPLSCLPTRVEPAAAVAGAVAVAGPMDLSLFCGNQGLATRYPRLRAALGRRWGGRDPVHVRPGVASLASPAALVGYAGAATPPHAFEHGLLDTTVPWNQTENMVDRLRRAGVTRVTADYPAACDHTQYCPHPAGDTYLERLVQELVTGPR